MKTAIIGGSFNPPHNGHLHLIRQVLASTDYRRIIIIPLHTPNHKQVEQDIAPEHRIAMVELLAAAVSHDCIVDTCEIDRGGVSYTYETVEYLLEAYDDIEEVGIIIGDDLLGGLHQWYRFDSLKEVASFVVIRRDELRSRVGRLIAELQKDGANIEVVDNATVDVSSSQIRELVSAGEDAAGLLPDNVLSYIVTHELYR